MLIIFKNYTKYYKILNNYLNFKIYMKWIINFIIRKQMINSTKQRPADPSDKSQVLI